jgi:hypothetical protein
MNKVLLRQMNFIPIALFFLNQILKQLSRSRKYSQDASRAKKLIRWNLFVLNLGSVRAFISPSLTEREVGRGSLQKFFLLNSPCCEWGKLGVVIKIIS